MFPLRNLKRNIYKFYRQPGYGTKIFIKRLKASFYYRWGRGRAPLPEAVTLFLTRKCNLKCRMCGQWGDRGVTRSSGVPEPDMGYNEIKKIILSLARFRPSLTLFGGEPLLYRDIDRVIRLIKKNKMHCLMITNGYLLAEHAKIIAEEGLDELNISIDGPQEVHDSIRGIEGLFSKIKEGLNTLQKYRENKRPLINLQTTITKYNVDSLEEMAEVAQEMGADSITFHHLIFLEKKDIEKTDEKYPELGSRDWDGFVSSPEIDPEKLAVVIENIIKKRKEYKFNINIYPNFSREEIVSYYKDKRWFPPSYSGKCKSPWVCAYIFPDGELRPCLNFKYSFGNLREEDFRDAWNGESAAGFRKNLKKNSRFPVCSRCTEIFRY